VSSLCVRRTNSGVEYACAEPTNQGVDSTAVETLICLHGIGGDHLSFAPQLESLSVAYRVIAWNMPGYRGSIPLANMTFDHLATALDRFRAELQLEKIHLVGQSIGGMIAQEYAVRSPQHIASMTLIATTAAFGGRDDSFKKSFLEARLAPLDAGRTMAELAPEFVPDIVGDIASPAVIDAATRSMAAVTESTYRDVMKCLVTFDRRAALSEYQTPVCLIAGEVDQNAPARTLKKMSMKIPDVEFHMIPGAGHLVNLESPAACNAIISDFIAAIAAR